MALPDKALPYGLRDVKITPIDVAGAYGTFIDLPVSQTFKWSDTADFSELRGDDQKQAEREAGGSVDWDLDSGGIRLEAYAAIAGGTVTTSGVTPNLIKTYSKKGTTTRPYFRVDGQAISDNGGDVHVVIYKAKATGDIEGEFTDGEFMVSSCSGSSSPNAADDLYDIIQNETASAITQPV